MAFSLLPRMQAWLGHLTQPEAVHYDEFTGSSARQQHNTQTNESSAAGPVISLNDNFKDFWGLERHWHNDGPDSARLSALASARASNRASQSEETLPDTPRMPLSEPLRDFWGLLRGMQQDISEKANLFADSMMPQKMLPKIEMESVEVVEVPYEVYFNILTILPASDWLPCSVRKNYPDLKNFHAALSRELPGAWLPGFPILKTGWNLQTPLIIYVSVNTLLALLAHRKQSRRPRSKTFLKVAWRIKFWSLHARLMSIPVAMAGLVVSFASKKGRKRRLIHAATFACV